MNTKGTALAPSKHLRSMVGILLGAVLALSACGTQEVGAAAIVNGDKISDQDVQTVSLELNKLAQGQQKFASSDVLVGLILAPYVLTEAERIGKGVSDAEVLKVIEKVPEPAPATMEFVRMNLALQSLDEAGRVAILSKLGEAKITVSPRYGKFDAKTVALVPTTPDWIKTTATPGAK